jgi:hypothetical protein
MFVAITDPQLPHPQRVSSLPQNGSLPLFCRAILAGAKRRACHRKRRRRHQVRLPLFVGQRMATPLYRTTSSTRRLARGWEDAGLNIDHLLSE